MLMMLGDNSGARLRNNDWIAVYRDLRVHPIIGFLNADGSKRRGASVCQSMAWVDLCMEANWKDRHENNSGQLVLVERGQLQGGRKWLSERWGWTEEQVRWFLKKLSDEGMILIDRPKITLKSHGDRTGSTPKQTAKSPRFVNIITVCNYNTYQTACELYDMLNPQTNPQTNPQITPKQPPDLNKRTREQEEDRMPNGILCNVLHNTPQKVDKKAKPPKSPVPETYSENFESFWALYPHKKGKGGASKYWERLTLDQKRKAYKSLRDQLPELQTQMKDIRGNFCPLPATWINQGRFDDAMQSPAAAAPRQYADRQKSADDAWLDREIAEAKRKGEIT